MRSSGIIGIIVAILVIGGLIWYFGSYANQTRSPSGAQQGNSQGTQAGSIGTSTAQQPSSTPKTVTVRYDGSSFNPSTVTISVGDTVSFVDSSSDPMWVASGVHPTHTVYDGTDRAEHCTAGYAGPVPFDECSASTGDYSFTFTKAGTWPFHNHVKASAAGQVIVQ